MLNGAGGGDDGEGVAGDARPLEVAFSGGKPDAFSLLAEWTPVASSFLAERIAVASSFLAE